MFFANLSRDHTIQSPFQVSSGVILAVFLFIGTFFNNWLRSVYPQGLFFFSFNGFAYLMIAALIAANNFQPILLASWDLSS